MRLFEPVFAALNEAAARYVVVGGVATVLHGIERPTPELDLIIDWAPAEALKAIGALQALGLEPRVPVDAEGLADPAVRAEWVERQGMRVLSLFQPKGTLSAINILATVPLPFEELWVRSELVQLPTTSVRVASIPDVIFLMSVAGGPQYREDIDALQEMQKTRSARAMG